MVTVLGIGSDAFRMLSIFVRVRDDRPGHLHLFSIRVAIPNILIHARAYVQAPPFPGQTHLSWR